MDMSTLRIQTKRAPPPPPPPSSSSSSRQCLLISSLSLLSLPLLFYLLSSAHSSSSSFGIVISAAPSASHIRVFRFLDGTTSTSSLSAASLPPLLLFAKSQVPKRDRATTTLLFFAADNNLLESSIKALRSSGFRFKDEWARVVSVEQRGVYAWVSANYALGSLKTTTQPQHTTGIVQLGAASLQVTFAGKETLEVESSPSRVIKLFGVTYHFYSHSLPQFGQDAAWESLYKSYKELTPFSNSRKESLVSPCVPRGYKPTVNATDDKLLVSSLGGNFSECKSQVLALLRRKQDKCLQAHCTNVSSFPFKIGGKPGSANFVFTSELFGLVPRASLYELEAAGQHYCEDEWDKQKYHHNIVEDSVLVKYCFSSAYMVALLHDNLGIPMDEKSVGFANQTGNILQDWTLGAFIVETMLEPLEWELNNLDQIVGNESVTYFSFFAFLLIAGFAVFFVLQSRKPQLKTIYDLEKGRYIITRVRR